MKETTLCYIENNGSYLMMLRNKKKNDPNQNKWIGIGGKIQDGETPGDCIKREIAEETGLCIENAVYRGKVYFLSDTWDDELMHLFTATTDILNVTPCAEGTLKWIKKEEILTLNLWEGDKIFLKHLLNDNKKIFNITLTYRGDSLISVKE